MSLIKLNEIFSFYYCFQVVAKKAWKKKSLTQIVCKEYDFNQIALY